MRFPIAQTWAIILVCLGGSPLFAEDSCAGSPFSNILRPRSIEESAGANVGPQIFDVASHPRGLMVMANNFGLLSYDGVRWRLLPLGRSGVALSVAVAPNGRMFAGGSRTFGEVVEDPTGQWLYQPLETRLAAADRSFSDVWQTLISPAGDAYFRSREKLMVVQDGEARAISPEGLFSAAGLVKGVMYAHDTGVGLVSIHPDKVNPVPGGRFFRGIMVTAITEAADGSMLVGTQDRGLFRFDPERETSQPLGATIRGLAAAEILSVRGLGDGQIAVGTLRSGLFMLDGNGALRYTMDRDTGLPNNAVLSLHASNGTLWLGTSGGAASLLAPNPVQNFGAREGLSGLVESVVRHGGSIYAATSQGVFRMTCRGPAFEPVPSLRSQAFALLSAGTLLAATADGIYEINGNVARLVRPGLARGFSKSKDAARLWAATQSGASALLARNGGWALDSELEVTGADPAVDGLAGVEATSVGEDTDGRLWISLVTGEVLSGLPVRGAASLELTEVSIFGAREGLFGGFAEVVTLKDGIRIGTGAAILKPEAGGLVTDPLLSNVLGAGQGAFRIEDARDGGYWVASRKRPIRLTRDGAGGALSIRSSALLRTPAGSRILDFLEVSDQEVWLGTDDGAFRYDPSKDTATTPISAHIRRVESNQIELFSGGPTDSLEGDLPHLAALRFEVSSSSLDDPSRNRFRFRLDGQDSDWGPWTAETRKDYTNLGPGSYRFRVETRDVYGRVGEEAAFSFVVATPWYLKSWALLLGFAALSGLFFSALTLRTRALRKRQSELEAIVAEKTAELRETSFTDPLTGLRNRRYFTEVIDAEVSMAGRPSSPALHMFLVDLDHFKQVNDTYGHAAGDSVLRQTADRLKVAMRTSDLIFRWGGEEFLIVARGAADLPRNELANRIVRMMGTEPFDIGNGTLLAKTCSVGFATYPFYPEDPETVELDAVIELADLGLYRAKQTGRNRAVGILPQGGPPVPGEVWKDKVLENLEVNAVSVEVVEGPVPRST